MEVIKSKKIVNFFFFLLVFLASISFALSFLLNTNRLDLPFLGTINADVRINIETEDENFLKLKVLINDNILDTPDLTIKNSYKTYDWDNYPVYSIKLKADKKDIEKIKNIVLTVGDKMSYYTPSDIKNFENKDNVYTFPKNEISIKKSSNTINYKGGLKEFSVKFLSVFYTPNLYIFPLLCLILAVLIYLNNKEKINISFNLFKNNAILWILLLALIFRIQGNDFPFWGDEIYTATVAGNPNLPFMSVFSDPGNPPFFFILERFYQGLTGKNTTLLRLLPCAFSILSIYAVYKFILFFKVEKKIALLAAFLLSINIYSIASGQELRCYSLCALFTVLSAYLTFKIIKQNKTKDYILYAILAVLMANTHYFQILILLGNFIFAMFALNNKKDRLKFFMANLIAAISFLPFFFMTALNKALLDPDFNILIRPDILYMVKLFIKYYFNGFIALTVFVVFIVTAIPKLRNIFFETKDSPEIKLYFYFMYMVLFLFISSYLFSQIRPIIREYYYVSIMPLIIIPLALIFALPFKKNFIKYLLISILIISPLFGIQFLHKEKALLINFQPIFNYLWFDSPSYRDKGLKIGAAVFDSVEYTNFYDEYLNRDEIFVLYKFPPVPNKMLQQLMTSAADVIYVRLEYRTFREMISTFLKAYNVSFIRVNKDVIVARLVKNTRAVDNGKN